MPENGNRTLRRWWFRRQPCREAEIVLGIVDEFTAKVIRTYPSSDLAVMSAVDIRRMLRLDANV